MIRVTSTLPVADSLTSFMLANSDALRDAHTCDSCCNFVVLSRPYIHTHARAHTHMNMQKHARTYNCPTLICPRRNVQSNVVFYVSIPSSNIYMYTYIHTYKHTHTHKYPRYTVQCNEGYYVSTLSNDIFVQSFESACQADKNMSNSTQQCAPITCQPPSRSDPAVANVSNTSLMPYLGQYSVICRPGYYVKWSLPNATCSNQSRFNVTCGVTMGYPQCVRIECDAAALGAGLDGNGTVSSSNTRIDFNQSVTITCREGFTVNASPNISLPATCGVSCAFDRNACVPVSIHQTCCIHSSVCVCKICICEIPKGCEISLD